MKFDMLFSSYLPPKGVKKYDSSWSHIATYNYDIDGIILSGSEILERLAVTTKVEGNFKDGFIGELAGQQGYCGNR